MYFLYSQEIITPRVLFFEFGKFSIRKECSSQKDLSIFLFMFSKYLVCKMLEKEPLGLFSLIDPGIDVFQAMIISLISMQDLQKAKEDVFMSGFLIPKKDFKKNWQQTFSQMPLLSLSKNYEIIQKKVPENIKKTASPFKNSLECTEKLNLLNRNRFFTEEIGDFSILVCKKKNLGNNFFIRKNLLDIVWPKFCNLVSEFMKKRYEKNKLFFSIDGTSIGVDLLSRFVIGFVKENVSDIAVSEQPMEIIESFKFQLGKRFFNLSEIMKIFKSINGSKFLNIAEYPKDKNEILATIFFNFLFLKTRKFHDLTYNLKIFSNNENKVLNNIKIFSCEIEGINFYFPEYMNPIIKKIINSSDNFAKNFKEEQCFNKNLIGNSRAFERGNEINTMLEKIKEKTKIKEIKTQNFQNFFDKKLVIFLIENIFANNK